MSTISLSKFLCDTPLYTEVEVSGFLSEKSLSLRSRASLPSNSPSNVVKHVTICEDLKATLYCGLDGCNEYSNFELLNLSNTQINLTKPSIYLLGYKCCNCKEKEYRFYLEITSVEKQYANNSSSFKIQKVGQSPRHGKVLPKKASKLLGSERDLFFKGTLSENQGMGIGAFTYYRRVLDAQKDKIFDEIIKVLRLSSGNEELISELLAAKKESQFTKAVDKIKSALPESLKIIGKNPLKLLYAALSKGLHSQTDQECLGAAQDIKLILCEFAEKLELALRNSDELASAVKRLVEKAAK